MKANLQLFIELLTNFRYLICCILIKVNAFIVNDTALSFKKNVISQKIVLFYSANFGGFSSLAYLLSQSHCVYKSKSQKPLNISFTPKQLP